MAGKQPPRNPPPKADGLGSSGEEEGPAHPTQPQDSDKGVRRKTPRQPRRHGRHDAPAFAQNRKPAEKRNRDRHGALGYDGQHRLPGHEIKAAKDGVRQRQPNARKSRRLHGLEAKAADHGGGAETDDGTRDRLQKFYERQIRLHGFIIVSSLGSNPEAWSSPGEEAEQHSGRHKQVIGANGDEPTKNLPYSPTRLDERRREPQKNEQQRRGRNQQAKDADGNEHDVPATNGDGGAKGNDDARQHRHQEQRQPRDGNRRREEEQRHRGRDKQARGANSDEYNAPAGQNTQQQAARRREPANSALRAGNAGERARGASPKRRNAVRIPPKKWQQHRGLERQAKSADKDKCNAKGRGHAIHKRRPSPQQQPVQRREANGPADNPARAHAAEADAGRGPPLSAPRTGNAGKRGNAVHKQQPDRKKDKS